MGPPRRAPVSSPRGRLRVRLTGRGAQVLFVGAASLLAAFSLGTTQFYQLSYALFGLFAAALALGIAGSRALSLERRLSREAVMIAGGSATVGLCLGNVSRLAASGVEIVDRLPHRSVHRLPAIPAGEERTTETTVSFVRRGLYEIGPAEVSSTDPFGLLRFRREAAPRREVLVYPEVHDLPGLPIRDSEEGGGRIHPASRGDEISGLRDYRPGDDRRFVHWKSLARTGELVVKEFAPDSPRRYSVILDLGRAGPGGRALEDAVSAAASVISRLDRVEISGRLRLTDRIAASASFGAGSGWDSYHAAMRLLATAEPDGAMETGEVLREEFAEGRLVEGVVLVERGAPETERRAGLARAVRELSSRGIAAVVILVAAHTYDTPVSREPGDAERRFAEFVRELELCGAAVRVLSRETGVAGLSAGVVSGDREAV